MIDQQAWTKGPWRSPIANPWSIEADRNSPLMKETNGHIAMLESGSYDRNLEAYRESMANAQLIASAPDLYEALEESLKWLLSSGASEVRKQVVAALRAARGEK